MTDNLVTKQLTEFQWTPWQWPRGAHSVLVTAPTEEPITLEQAKLLCGFDWPSGDPREDMLRGFISAARAKVEADTGLALLTQTRDLYFTEAALTLYGYVPLANQVFPVQSIVEATALDAAGRTRQPLAVDAFAVHGPALVPRTAPDGAGVVRLIVGWLDAAELRSAAPLLSWAVGVLTAHYATLGRDLATADGATIVPFGYEEAIGPHRLIWVT